MLVNLYFCRIGHFTSFLPNWYTDTKKCFDKTFLSSVFLLFLTDHRPAFLAAFLAFLAALRAMRLNLLDPRL